MLYFAYGSNLLPARLQQRVPSAIATTTGYIHHCRLVFNKVGRDGSSKANIESAPNSRVYGAIYCMDPSEQWALDHAESLGIGYEHHWVTVHSESGESTALTYRALRTAPELLPYIWYRDLVVQGAEAHGLLPAYTAAIAQHPAITDPDPARRQRHQKLLNLSIHS